MSPRAEHPLLSPAPAPKWRVLLAAGTALGVVVGAAVGLAWVSRGVPAVVARLVASPRQFGTLGREALGPSGVLASVVGAGWLAWGWAVSALAGEVRARWRRTPRARPAGPMQHLIGLAASGLVALAPLLRSPGAARAPRRPPVSVSAQVATAASPAVGSMPKTSPETPARWYVVQPGDTLWSIAANELGSPLRWPELVTLNEGRPQPGGGVLEDDHWIQPGWRLLLPAVPVQSSPKAAEPAVAPVVMSGPAHPIPAHPIPAHPIPAHPIPARRGPARPVRRRARWATPLSAEVSAASAHPGGSGVPLGPGVAVILGALAAGLAFGFDQTRRTRHRPGRGPHRLDRSERELVALERALRRRADLRSRRLATQALRQARQAARPPGSVPVAVKVATGQVAVLLDPPVGTLPAPFEAGVDTGWSVLEGAALDGGRFANDLGVPGVLGSEAPEGEAPLLSTLGRAGDAELFVDLAALGTLAVVGPAAPSALNALVLELATRGRGLRVLAVGFPCWAAKVPGVVACGDLDEARRLASAAERAPGRTVVVVAPGVTPCEPTPGAQAGYGPGDAGLGPGVVAVVLGDPLPWVSWRCQPTAGGWELVRAGRTSEPEARNDGGTAEGGTVAGVPIGAVLCPEPTAESEDRSATGAPGVGARIVPVQLSELQRVDEATSAQLAGLLGEAPAWTSASGASPDHGPEEGEVLVRLLGPVVVEGAERPFARRWALDLVVYLALHPNGATTEAWATALWPDRLMAPATVHSTASAARRALGRRRDGSDHLPRSHGALRLADSVRTDWAVLERAARASGPEAWREGLALVRGRPLEGLAALDWAVLEGVLPAIEATVVDLADRYGAWALAVGRPQEAEWAARQGLRACPYDERLYRLLLRAADQQGNPAGVEAVMAELVRLVADGVEPVDAVHPETWALYQQLSRRRTRLPRVG